MMKVGMNVHSKFHLVKIKIIKELYQDMNLLVGYAALKYNKEKTEYI